MLHVTMSRHSNGSLITNLTTSIGQHKEEADTVLLGVSDSLLITAFSLILAIGVLGNSFVIYVFGYRRKRIGRTTTDWLILCLGITDFFSTIFNSSLFIYWTATAHRRWDFGYIGCKIIPAMGPILITASSGVILIFAIDRYVAIVNPFHGQLSLDVTAIACIVNIVLSILSYAHYIYMIEIKNGICVSRPVNDLNYGIPNCTLIILRLSVFASLFVFTSIRIFSKLRDNESSLSVKSKTQNDTNVLQLTPGTTATTTTTVTTSMKRKAKKIRQSNNIARVLITIGFVFILLVFPREIFYLAFNLSWLISDRGIQGTQWLLHMNSWLKVMHTANCCANVFIYAHMHSRFRRILLRYLLCCVGLRDEVSASYMTTVSRYNSMMTKTDRNHSYSRALYDEDTCL